MKVWTTKTSQMRGNQGKRFCSTPGGPAIGRSFSTHGPQLMRLETLSGKGQTMKAVSIDAPTSETTPKAASSLFSEDGKYVWTEAWYPIGELKDFDKSKPNPFTLLNKGIVIWFEPKSQQWRCFRDLCPHRLIPLSEGRINERGHLECGYHGWEFSGGGACENIPQAMPGAVGHKSERACVENYPCTVKQGLLWVRPTPIATLMARDGSLGEEQIPIIEELDKEEGWVVQDAVRDLPYDISTLLENVLDVSHVSYTHHGTIANRKRASPTDYKVTRESAAGFEGIWSPTSAFKDRSDSLTTVFKAPIFMEHTINAWTKVGIISKITVYGVPIAPGKCRIVGRFPFKFKSPLIRLMFSLEPRWMQHHKRNMVLEDDNVFLAQQEREVGALQTKTGKEAPQLYYSPTTGDAFVNAYRNWLIRRGGPFGLSPEQYLKAIGPLPPLDQLMDRYHSHTKNCKACSGALANIERLQTALRALSPALVLLGALSAASAAAAKTAGTAAVALSLALPFVGPVATFTAPALWTLAGSLGAVGLGAWLLAMFLDKYKQRFLMGTYPPPRNAH